MSLTMSRISPKGLNGILAAALAALIAATLPPELKALSAAVPPPQALLNPCTVALLAAGLALWILARAAMTRSREDRSIRTTDA